MSSRDRVFCGVTIFQCAENREMVQAEIEALLTTSVEYLTPGPISLLA